MKSEDLLAIVDFLYCGEAKVFQEDLDSFLSIADELQLKGLMGKPDEKGKDFEVDEKCLPSNTTFSPEINTNPEISKTSFKRQAPNRKIHNPEEERTLAIPSNYSGDLEELEERVKSMMEKSENKYAMEISWPIGAKCVERRGWV